MGRRKPQQEVIDAQRELLATGREVPFFGLPASSGYDIAFAHRICPVDDTEESVTISANGELKQYDPPEWGVLYHRQVGSKVWCHEQSRLTGRARLGVVQKRRADWEDVAMRFEIATRTARAASHAHTVTAERKAQAKLRKHLTAYQWRSYVLTGMFDEPSRKSGLFYFFRKNAPTIVTKLVVVGNGLYLKVLVTLCMHPVGYTERSAAGCMCPSDDVIAHLLLMRADEHLFWRKAVHHTATDPRSML